MGFRRAQFSISEDPRSKAGNRKSFKKGFRASGFKV